MKKNIFTSIVIAFNFDGRLRTIFTTFPHSIDVSTFPFSEYKSVLEPDSAALESPPSALINPFIKSIYCFSASIYNFLRL
jgi:hypothetical protein